MLSKIRKIFKLLEDQRIRFLIGGGFNTFCNILIFNILYFFQIIENIDFIFYISSLFSILISVFVLRFFVFKKKFKIKPVVKTFFVQVLIMFFGVILFNFAIQISFHALISQFFTALISAIASYFINKIINAK